MMEYSNRYIVELTRAAVFDDVPFEPEQEPDWKYIYQKSIEQNIAGLVFSAISKLPGDKRPGQELYAKWQQMMLETIALSGRQYGEFLSVSKAAAQRGLVLAGLKGCIIRELFPVPELRTMSDYDVLTRPENLDEVKAFFAERGYEVKKDVSGTICEKSIFYWEISTTVEKEFRTKPHKYNKMFFDAVVCENGIYTVKPTQFFLQLIIHTGKHYIGTGAGVRNLADIALYAKVHGAEIDFDAVKAACGEQNYLNICRYILSALRLFYGVETDGEEHFGEEKTAEFVEYMLLNGVFGDNRAMSIQAAKPDDDSERGLKKILFPSAKSLGYRYRYLKKAPFLLPVAWVHRLLSAIFVHKYSPVMMAKQLKEADVFSKERVEKLESLGIFEKH